jgi:hypothetical protein
MAQLDAGGPVYRHQEYNCLMCAIEFICVKLVTLDFQPLRYPDDGRVETTT